jgi:hypothetical protein
MKLHSDKRVLLLFESIKNGTPKNKLDSIMKKMQFVANSPQVVVIKPKQYHYPIMKLKNPKHVLVEEIPNELR